MRENSIEKRLKNKVEKHGGKALKFVSPGTRGVPDRIILLPGARTLFVELKAPGKVLRPLQAKRASELRKLGFIVQCFDSFQAVDDFVRKEFGE